MFRIAKDILSAKDGAGDLFHFGAALGVTVLLFLEVMYSVHHGWTIDPDFASHFGAVILASAAAFPIRDLNRSPQEPPKTS
jgi:hypothetical protein